MTSARSTGTQDADRIVGWASRAILRRATDLESIDVGPNRVAFALSGDDTGGAYSLSDFTMAAPPAPGPPPHIHDDADEAIYVLEGTLRMGVADEHVTGSAGALMLAPRGALHSIANVGTGPARFIVVLSAPGFEGFWREMAELRAASGLAPHPDAVLALQGKYGMRTGGVARRLE